MKMNKIAAVLVTSSCMIYGGHVAYASIPASAMPVFGTALVDGDPSEWNLATDFAAEMREAGKASKDLLSKLYLRYNCNTETMYVLVLAEDGYEALESANDAWVKFDSLPGNGKVVDGNEANDGIPPDFAWVHDGSKLVGYEASFTLAPGTYTKDVEFHIQIEPGRTSSTGKGGQGGTMEYLTLEVPADCPSGGSSLAVDLLDFTAKATGNGSKVEWRTGHEADISAFYLYRGIPKVGTECTANQNDYNDLTPVDTINSGDEFYKVKDKFTAIANTTYCYGLVSINDNGDIVDVLGATPRQ